MNQCVQANFENRASNEDIGSHLLQIPQVQENNNFDESTFRDETENTFRPYVQNQAYKVEEEIAEPEE